MVCYYSPTLPEYEQARGKLGLADQAWIREHRDSLYISM